MTTPFTFVLSFAAQLVRPFRSARLGSRPRSPLSWRTRALSFPCVARRTTHRIPLPVRDAASLYCRLGETNQALEWLQKAYQERSPRMEELKEEPAFDNLRSDPRFGDFLRRVGLLQR